MSVSSFSTSSSTSSSSGPAWDFSTLFGREHESQLLQSLADRQPADGITTAATTTTTTNQTIPGRTVLLHGPAGSGKSALVKQQPWQEERGWSFTSGKFVAANREISEPFSALIEAMNDLVDMWLQHNDTAVVCRLDGFRSLLDKDVEFLRSILPKAYKAVKSRGQQCQMLHRGTMAAATEQQDQQQQNQQQLSIPHDLDDAKSCQKHRRPSFTMKQDLCTIDCVNASFVRILTFLCQKQPVVLFLDDIHLADAASLKVIQVLATTGRVDNLLLILSYQDELMTTNPQLPLQKSLDKIRQFAQTEEDVAQQAETSQLIPEEEEEVEDPVETPSSTRPEEEKNSSNDVQQAERRRRRKRRIQEIEVKSLSVESVNELVASITKQTVDETLPLARVVHKKTAGNAFFVTQFLQMLRQEDFLRFSYVTLHWEWGDVDKLESAAHVSDNVADLVLATIGRLPEATKVALKVSASLGKIIPLHVLIKCFESYDESEAGTTCSLGLHQIKLQGLQTVLDNAVKVGILIRPKGQDTYMWAHDKLQTVAYSLTNPCQRCKLHLKLGRLLWEMSSVYPDEEWMVFMAADQMNRFSEQHQSNRDHEALGAEVATLCLEAARLSLAKSALYPAHDMLKAGVKHMKIPNKWKAHYDLCLNLFSTFAELSGQLGENDESLKAIQEVESNARNFEDKFRVQMVHLKLVTSGQDRSYQRGLDKSSEILKEYGVRMPQKLLPGMLTLECNKLRRRLPGGKLEGLFGFPEMTDLKTRQTIKLLAECSLFALLTQKRSNNNLAWYPAMRILSLSIDHKAVTEETAMAIITLGASQSFQGKFKEANELGETGLKLLDRFPQTVGSIHCMAMSGVAGAVFSSTKPLNKCLDLWLDAHHVGLRTGNTGHAGSSIMAYAMTYIACGLPLGPLLSDLEQYEKEVIQFNLPGTMLAAFKILEQFILNLQKRGPNPTVLRGDAMDQDKLLATFRGEAHTMTKRDISSFRMILSLVYRDWRTAEELIGNLESFLESDQFLIRASLRRSAVALAAFQISRANGRRKLRQMARKITKEFRDELKRGNVNALPLYTMLEAEESPSKEKYDNAIRSCARLGLVHYEAYMCEQAGYYFLESDKKDEDWAEFYLAQALMLYEDWGATGKAERLKEAHPRVLRSSSLRERANTALKGRSRYSSSHTDLLNDFDFERLSTLGSSTSSLLTSSSLATGSDLVAGGGLQKNNQGKDHKDLDDDVALTATTDDSSSESDGYSGRFGFANPVS